MQFDIHPLDREEVKLWLSTCHLYPFHKFLVFSAHLRFHCVWSNPEWVCCLVRFNFGFDLMHAGSQQHGIGTCPGAWQVRCMSTGFKAQKKDPRRVALGWWYIYKFGLWSWQFESCKIFTGVRLDVEVVSLCVFSEVVGNWDDADMGLNGCMHFERHRVLPSLRGTELFSFVFWVN